MVAALAASVKLGLLALGLLASRLSLTKLHAIHHPNDATAVAPPPSGAAAAPRGGSGRLKLAPASQASGGARAISSPLLMTT